MTDPKTLPPVPPEEESDSDRDWDRRHACKDGKCCFCGTEKPEETPCQKSPDGVHCSHWWDGKP